MKMTIKNKKLKLLSCLAKMNGWILEVVINTSSKLFALEMRTDSYVLIFTSKYSDSIHYVANDIIEQLHFVKKYSSIHFINPELRRAFSKCFDFDNDDELEIQLVLAGAFNDDCDYVVHLEKACHPVLKSYDFNGPYGKFERYDVK